MGMPINEAITRYKNNAEYERTHGNLQGCLEFRQLVKWLEQLQKIKHIINDVPYLDKDEYKIASIKEIINGNDD